MHLPVCLRGEALLTIQHIAAGYAGDVSQLVVLTSGAVDPVVLESCAGQPKSKDDALVESVVGHELPHVVRHVDPTVVKGVPGDVVADEVLPHGSVPTCVSEDAPQAVDRAYRHSNRVVQDDVVRLLPNDDGTVHLLLQVAGQGGVVHTVFVHLTLRHHILFDPQITPGRSHHVAAGIVVKVVLKDQNVLVRAACSFHVDAKLRRSPFDVMDVVVFDHNIVAADHRDPLAPVVVDVGISNRDVRRGLIQSSLVFVSASSDDEHSVPSELMKLDVLDQHPFHRRPGADAMTLVVGAATCEVVLASVAEDLTSANCDVAISIHVDDAVIVPVIRHHLDHGAVRELEGHVALEVDARGVDVVRQFADQVATAGKNDLVEVIVCRPNDGFVDARPCFDRISSLIRNAPALQLNNVFAHMDRGKVGTWPLARFPRAFSFARNRHHRGCVTRRRIGWCRAVAAACIKRRIRFAAIARREQN